MERHDDSSPQWPTVDGALARRFLTGSFVRGVEFITAIAEVAEAAGHHPDIVLTYPHVDITIITHDTGSITEKDHALAAEITAIADAQGINADR